MVKQVTLDEESKTFWKTSTEQSRKQRYVNFVDGQEQELEIKDWNIRMYDSGWGDKPAINCVDGRILKVESVRLRFELQKYVGKHVSISITRNESVPNPLNTWYEAVLIQEH